MPYIPYVINKSYFNCSKNASHTNISMPDNETIQIDLDDSEVEDMKNLNGTLTAGNYTLNAKLNKKNT